MTTKAKRVLGWALAAALLAAPSGLPLLAGNDPNACDEPGEAPDVIVGNITSRTRWGAVGDVTAFSLGTASCNIGTCWMNSFATPSNQHPVIGQNMFRLDDGRFEQIGQSWVSHGFFALSQALCHNDCVPTNGQHLGVHCSNTYSSSINGYQPQLGPKFEVDPAAGSHPHPVTDQNETGDAIYKRLQVHDADLDPEHHFGATYFVEVQYLSADDALAGNQNNNASYRPIDVLGTGGVFDFAFIGATVREEPAISAWAAYDSGVELVNVDVPADGRFVLGSKVTDLGGGVWRYEYAVHNLNSRRAGGSFSVPIPVGSTPTNVGFHDVDYHSGEPFDGTDWAVTVDGGTLSWATEAFDVNPDANALRWGTLYNFRFDLDAPPIDGVAALGLFAPGITTEVAVATRVPLPCNDNGSCEAGESCLCLAECPGDGDDGDGDLVGVCADCDDGDADVWGTPGEVLGLALAHQPLFDATTVSWDPPAEPGAIAVDYEVLRSTDPQGFTDAATECMYPLTPSNTWIVDNKPISPGALISYLVRAINGCAASQGTLGTTSAETERPGRTCP